MLLHRAHICARITLLAWLIVHWRWKIWFPDSHTIGLRFREYSMLVSVAAEVWLLGTTGQHRGGVGNPTHFTYLLDLVVIGAVGEIVDSLRTCRILLHLAHLKRIGIVAIKESTIILAGSWPLTKLRVIRCSILLKNWCLSFRRQNGWRAGHLHVDILRNLPRIRCPKFDTILPNDNRPTATYHPSISIVDPRFITLSYHHI